jgi:hypothetical protein
MGRTIPSFCIALATDQAEWKPFRKALDKSKRKSFDEMWDVPKMYVSACSDSVQLVPLHPIIISILLHHYKELKECISEVERIIGETAEVNDKKTIRRILANELKEGEKKEVKEEAVLSSTITTPMELDGYFV